MGRSGSPDPVFQDVLVFCVGEGLLKKSVRRYMIQIDFHKSLGKFGDEIGLRKVWRNGWWSEMEKID